MKEFVRLPVDDVDVGPDSLVWACFDRFVQIITRANYIRLEFSRIFKVPACFPHAMEHTQVIPVRATLWRARGSGSHA